MSDRGDGQKARGCCDNEVAERRRAEKTRARCAFAGAFVALRMQRHCGGIS